MSDTDNTKKKEIVTFFLHQNVILSTIELSALDNKQFVDTIHYVAWNGYLTHNVYNAILNALIDGEKQ